MARLTPDTFRRVLTPANVRTLQVIESALAAGVTLFAVVIFFLYLTRSAVPGDAADVQLIRMLTYGHLLVAVGVYTVVGRVYAMMLGGTGAPATAEEAWNRLRTAGIVRLALLEGVALFGLVVCLLAVIAGVMARHPGYWINLISAVGMVGFVALHFPTTDRLEQTFRTHFGG
ncbi:MAG: hypothetical protein KatS3mg044_0750 [Rhodothermaceae bacterium]|nr:MAG: hypothetical protein KatS3mg044_0750 [Rhodothermaceae bacterium]